MLPNAPKIPSCYFIWRRHLSCGPSRLYLATKYYGRGGSFKLKTPRNGYNYRYYSENVAKPKQPAGPCPPPQPGFEKTLPKSSIGLGTTIALFGIGAAAVVAYAKYDPDFRKYIEENSPGFNEFLKITFQEEQTYGETWDDFVTYLTDWFTKLLGLDKRSDKGKDGKPIPICPPPPESTYEAPKSAFQPLLDQTPEKEADKYNEIRVLQPPSPDLPAPNPVTITETARPVFDVSDLPEFHPKNIVDLEKHIAAAAEDSVKSFHKALCALRDHSDNVFKILEAKVGKIEPSVWSDLKTKGDEKEKMVKEAEKSAYAASERVKRLQCILEDPAFDAPQSLKDQARRNVGKMLQDIEKAKKDLAAERERAEITDKYWNKVEEGRRHFQDELEILFPSLKIDEKKFDIHPGELDLFVVHAYRHVLFYQKELAKLQTVGEYRIRHALEQEGAKISDELVEARVKAELEKEKRQLFEDLEKKILSVKADRDREMRDQMKRQLEVAEDHLHDAIVAKEKEWTRKNQRLLDEKVEAERSAYKLKLAEMVGRMRAVEDALSNRVEHDQLASQAHVIFSACQSLYRALRSGIPGVHWSKQLRPLEPEIVALQKASGSKDQLINAVIGGIPEEARKRGVYPEIAIRERFLKVERVARRLALIPEQGGSLPRYLLSYIQSLLLFQSVNPIPSTELEDQPIDLSKLDTYDILQRARYWLDRGDFTMALRYMNLLKGAPRQISCEWINETRIFLETQQAADALMAYAAATGLQYL